MGLSSALHADGIETSFAIQESVEVPELAALIVSIGTGLGGVAAVLSAYLRRHQDKSILMERGGTRYELKGMSVDEMKVCSTGCYARRSRNSAARNTSTAASLVRTMTSTFPKDP